MANNNTVRITKTMKYEGIIAALNGNTIPHDLTVADLTEFAQSEIDQIAKKNASKSAASAEKEAEDAVYMAAIERFLASLSPSDEGRTVSELNRQVAELSDQVASKVTYLCTKLKNEGRITNHKKGNKSLYTIA